MSAETDAPRPTTTLSVEREVHSRLESLKPYDSMSFSDLIADMADQYEEST